MSCGQPGFSLTGTGDGRCHSTRASLRLASRASAEPEPALNPAAAALPSRAASRARQGRNKAVDMVIVEEEEPITTDLPLVGAATTRHSRPAPAAPKPPKTSKRGRRAAEQVKEEQEEPAQPTPAASKAATLKAATPKPATTAAEVLAAAKALRRTQQAVMVSRVEAAAAEALAVRKASAREECKRAKKLKRQAKAAEASHPFKVVALDCLHVTNTEHGTTPAVGFQKDRLFAKHTRSGTMLLPTTTKGPPFAFGR